MPAETQTAPFPSEEQTPLLTEANELPASEPSAQQEHPTLHPRDDRPAYSLSALLDAHRQLSHRTGMAWVAVLGIWIWIVTVWVTVLTHPAGIFTIHPIFQSFSLFCFYHGIIFLQPTDTPAAKRTGLVVHESFQLLGSLAIVVGGSAIFYNKVSHSAPHFTSWHGLLGLTSTCLILFQALFGMLIGFETSRDYIVGDSLGRKLWKFHRASGYLLIFLMTMTVLTVTKADWVISVTSKWSIWVLTVSPIVALIGLLSLVNPNKIFGRR
ncbi:hypothetical protein PCANC_04708 [Puccinia coronata f. sp. avenae]|uniref:Cytochrome b561 domain-containing protein n=1 Tax=Puccinia coronata f. sp. avenae TaxID=200324 RepID=A0A2N5SXU7_9BASI|nr:hypothetical protein PCANC_14709 [Puccinia coronata f. sp. avenae]PLW43524.1 hypothetical protein PCASD_06758 [Puccinia coronata f. sp. avenae]PLW56144.1 hypothetical protein PCANC_04708 [Puccinia coronata f. sp. avenae]